MRNKVSCGLVIVESKVDNFEKVEGFEIFTDGLKDWEKVICSI